MKKIVTVAWIHIENNKLLLLRSKNKQAFYMPGGKLDAGESDNDAVVREIQEELAVTLDAESLQHVITVKAQAYGEDNGTEVEIRCYLGSYTGDLTVSHEIAEMKYFSLDEYLQTETAPAVLKIFEYLMKNNLLV